MSKKRIWDDDSDLEELYSKEEIRKKGGLSRHRKPKKNTQLPANNEIIDNLQSGEISK